MQGTAPNAARARREFDTAPYLARAVATLNALVPRPDIAVVIGDLVDHGEPEEYEQLRHLLARLSMPVFVIPGNHDAREPLREAFRSARYLPVVGYLQYASSSSCLVGTPLLLSEHTTPDCKHLL